MRNDTLLDPAVHMALEELNIMHRAIECNPDWADTAVFCEHYDFTPGQSANTIIVASRTDSVRYCACIVLATTRLDVNKKVCQLLGV